MPIIDLQRQFRELGRIRLGAMKGNRPIKLDTFRLTSPARDLLDRAASIYGGEVNGWKSGSDGDSWELITDRDALDIIVPPGQTLSQWNEMWGAGGCLRRCDSQREWLSGAPCLCPADPADRNALAAKGQACKPTTRLSVALPSLPDLGTWLLVSHGYYAAVELAGTYELLAASSDQGRMIPAILAIDHRTIKHQGQPRKDITVPVIRLPNTITELMAGTSDRPQIAAPNERLALPEPAALPGDATITPPFTRDDLIRLAESAHIDLETVVETARQMFPAGNLTDADRRAVWAEISEQAVTEAESLEMFSDEEQARIDAALASVVS